MPNPDSSRSRGGGADGRPAAPPQQSSPPPQSSRLLRVAMVGCGNISSYHLDAICAADPVRVAVTAVVDPDVGRAEAFASQVYARLGAKAKATAAAVATTTARPRVFASLAEALAADPDHRLFEACDVMVPSWDSPETGGDLHEQVAVAVLRSGRHLLLEKPIAVTSAAARRIIAEHQHALKQHSAAAANTAAAAAAAATPRFPHPHGGATSSPPPPAPPPPASAQVYDSSLRRGAPHHLYRHPPVFSVAENAQHWPEVVAAGRLLAAGAIGNVLTATAKFWESAVGEWAADYLPGSWRCDPRKLPAASFTFDGATHWVRPLRMWLGEVAAVAGTMGVAVAHMAGPSMSQHVLRFRSGRAAVFESMLAPTAISDQPFFRIQGTKGEIVIDGFGGGARIYTAGVDGATTCREFCHEGWDAGYALEYADFVAACLDGVSLAAGAESALADLQVVEAMNAADQDQRQAAWAKVESVLPDHHRQQQQQPPTSPPPPQVASVAKL